MPAAVLIAQAVLTGLLAAWMLIAARDNWSVAALNGEIVRAVLRLDRLREAYPAEYALVRHRRIEDPRAHRVAYRLIVLWETLAGIVLTLGAVLLGLAALGLAPAEAARVLALAGALLFVATWAGFLIAGNHFVYWYCHEGAQSTHLQLVLWGLGTMLFLALPD